MSTAVAGVAASVGPYGAVLGNGAEYTGDYPLGARELAVFHGRRLEVLDAAGADVLAVETIPSIVEASALARLLDGCRTPSWVSFTCRDGSTLRDGTPFAEAVSIVTASDRVLAVGVNCTAPHHVLPLIEAARSVSEKPIVVYPNRGAAGTRRPRAGRVQSPPSDLAGLVPAVARRRRPADRRAAAAPVPTTSPRSPGAVGARGVDCPRCRSTSTSARRAARGSTAVSRCGRRPRVPELRRGEGSATDLGVRGHRRRLVSPAIRPRARPSGGGCCGGSCACGGADRRDTGPLRHSSSRTSYSSADIPRMTRTRRFLTIILSVFSLLLVASAGFAASRPDAAMHRAESRALPRPGTTTVRVGGAGRGPGGRTKGDGAVAPDTEAPPTPSARPPATRPPGSRPPTQGRPPVTARRTGPPTEPTKLTGLDNAIAHVLANCLKNPDAPGLVNALEHLVANQAKHEAHDA